MSDPDAPAPPTLAECESALGVLVNGTARGKGYASAESCAGYVASTVPAWAAEAAAFVAWRDAVYLAAYAMLDDVQAGDPAPTLSGLIAAMPEMEWPA